MNEPPMHEWMAIGESCFEEALRSIGPEAIDNPSLLPGWSRRRIVAHVARNADALVNLLTWARTGVETPMYPSTEARDAAIDATSQLPFEQLKTDSAAASQRLLVAVQDLPRSAWTRPVRTAQARIVPASEVLWMRCRETWIHAADLCVAVGFADFPAPLLEAILDDVVSVWERRKESVAVRFRSGGRTWGSGSVTLDGPLPSLAAWATGRQTLDDIGLAAAPHVPRWL